MISSNYRFEIIRYEFIPFTFDQDEKLVQEGVSVFKQFPIALAEMKRMNENPPINSWFGLKIHPE